MPLIKKLFAEYTASLNLDLSFQDFEKELENLPGKYAPPEGSLILAEENGIPAGCVALRKFGTDGDICEMKRLYVPDSFRKRGIGKELVCRIIAQGTAMGYGSMLLDTLSTMAKARELYEAAGFKRIDPYYHNPLEGAIFMELDLKEKKYIRDNLRALSLLPVEREPLPESYIFDYGGVISFNQKEEYLIKMAKAARTGDFSLFEKAYRENRHDYDAGTADGRQYWEKVLSVQGILPDEGLCRKLIDMDIEGWTDINHETVEVIRSLKSRGAYLALLSNMPQDMLEFIRENKNGGFSWLDCFDIRLFSCEVNICKPDPSIFALCLEKGSINPGSAVFIDDMKANISGAERCGIKGLLFRGADNLKEVFGLL